MDLNDLTNFAYETDENGEKMLVRSIESTKRAYIRFTNKTKRHVDVWWRNFKGGKMHYVRLRAYSSFDINTYMTHPWEFSDVSSKESYVIENKRIFRAPKEIADQRYRTNWNITIGMRSLRKTCLVALAQMLRYQPHVARRLELPQVLERDLRETIVAYNRPVTPEASR